MRGPSGRWAGQCQFLTLAMAAAFNLPQEIDLDWQYTLIFGQQLAGSSEMPLDAIDRKILGLLQEDGRISLATLADKVGLSASPCLRRMRLLEKAGIISRYVAV